MEDFFCEACFRNGLHKRKHLYQINFEEAIFLCENKECPDLYSVKDVNKLVVRCSPSSSPKTQNNLKRQVIASLSPSDFVQKPSRIAPAVKPASNVELLRNSGSLNGAQQSSFLFTPALTVGSETTSTFVLTELSVNNNDVQVQPSTNSANNSSLVNGNGSNGNKNFRINVVRKSPESVQSSTAFCSSNCKKYPHWINRQAMCWLDVCLNMLVHNETLKKALHLLSEDNVIKKLCTVYQQALSSVNLQNPTSRNLNKVNCVNQSSFYIARSMLDKVRDLVFAHLQGKLKCEEGKEDSPVFALESLLKDINVDKAFINYCRLQFRCQACDYQQTRSVQKPILSLDKVPSDFSLTNPKLVSTCFMCKAPNQIHDIIFDRLAPCIMIHFVNGLPVKDWSFYDFQMSNSKFAVTAVIQYKQNPKGNHFVVWIRDVKDNRWIECDDLKPPHLVCFCKGQFPKLQQKECHVVVWERLDSADLDPVPYQNSNAESPRKNCVVSPTFETDFEFFLSDHPYCSPPSSSALNSPEKDTSSNRDSDVVVSPTFSFLNLSEDSQSPDKNNKISNEEMSLSEQKEKKTIASDVSVCTQDEKTNISSVTNTANLSKGESSVNETKEVLSIGSNNKAVKSSVCKDMVTLANIRSSKNKVDSQSSASDSSVSVHSAATADVQSSASGNKTSLAKPDNVNKEATLKTNCGKSDDAEGLSSSKNNQFKKTIDTTPNKAKKKLFENKNGGKIAADNSTKKHDLRSQKSPKSNVSPKVETRSGKTVKTSSGNANFQFLNDKAPDISFTNSQCFIVVVHNDKKQTQTSEVLLSSDEAIQCVRNFGEPIKTLIVPNSPKSSTPLTDFVSLVGSRSSNSSNNNNNNNNNSIKISMSVKGQMASTSCTQPIAIPSTADSVTSRDRRSIRKRKPSGLPATDNHKESKKLLKMPSPQEPAKQEPAIIRLGANQESAIMTLDANQEPAIMRLSAKRTKTSSNRYNNSEEKKQTTIKELPKNLASLLNICIQNKASSSTGDQPLLNKNGTSAALSSHKTALPSVPTLPSRKMSKVFQGYQSKLIK